MLVVKKNLRVSERFPYPVRVEAVLELIDQFPARRLEKMTRKGSNIRFCNAGGVSKFIHTNLQIKWCKPESV